MPSSGRTSWFLLNLKPRMSYTISSFLFWQIMGHTPPLFHQGHQWRNWVPLPYLYHNPLNPLSSLFWIALLYLSISGPWERTRARKSSIDLGVSWWVGLYWAVGDLCYVYMVYMLSYRVMCVWEANRVSEWLTLSLPNAEKANVIWYRQRNQFTHSAKHMQQRQ